MGKVIVTWLMNALLSIGYTIGWSAVHSMLVKRMGVEYLPYTYIGISLLGVMGSSVYLRFADAVRRDRLLIYFAGATGLVLLLSRFLVSARQEGNPELSTSLVLFFVAVFFAQGLGNATLGTQVWTIINDLFRPSQGRRLYPIIGTAGTLGGIAAGASIHFLVGHIGTANLVLIWAASTWALIPLTAWLKKRYGGELRGRGPSASTEKKESHLLEGWRYFRKTPLAITLGCVAVLFWVVGSLADFQYTKIMAAEFPSEEKLSSYYGIYGMVINISGLLVQIFFSGYLIRLIGVSRGLCALPLTVLAGFGMIAAQAGFWPGIWLRYSWDMVGMTVQGNSYNLALNAIPAALRARIRGMIEGIINPLGGVLGGVLILALHHAFDATSHKGGWQDPVTLCGIALGVGWILLTARSQKHYMKMVESNLASSERRTCMDAIDCLEEPGNPQALLLLAKIGKSGDVEQRAAAARIWGNIRGHHATDQLLTLISDETAKVRIETVRSLDKTAPVGGLATPVETVLRQIIEHDTETLVRAEAVRVLLHHHSQEGLASLATGWLSHPSPDVRARVIEALIKVEGDHTMLLENALRDAAPLVVATAAQALCGKTPCHPVASTTLASLLGSTDAVSHTVALTACLRSGHCPSPLSLPAHLTSSDPITRALAALAVLRFAQDAQGHPQALLTVLAVMADPTHTDRLRIELLPLVPDLGERVSDALLMAAAHLEPEKKSIVSKVLKQWYHILDARLDNHTSM